MDPLLDGFTVSRDQMKKRADLEDNRTLEIEKKAYALLLDEQRLDDFLGDQWDALGSLVCRGLMALISETDFPVSLIREALIKEAIEAVQSRADP